MGRILEIVKHDGRPLLEGRVLLLLVLVLEELHDQREQMLLEQLHAQQALLRRLTENLSRRRQELRVDRLGRQRLAHRGNQLLNGALAAVSQDHPGHLHREHLLLQVLLPQEDHGYLLILEPLLHGILPRVLILLSPVLLGDLFLPPHAQIVQPQALLQAPLPFLLAGGSLILRGTLLLALRGAGLLRRRHGLLGPGLAPGVRLSSRESGSPPRFSQTKRRRPQRCVEGVGF
mmetsp:Transcript_21271/g.52367  ORF Transcript_21271/g.52367 Transcript_21271/m.52367 type:complete len:232 (-) Transcript_21271:58-753(-)